MQFTAFQSEIGFLPFFKAQSWLICIAEEPKFRRTLGCETDFVKKKKNERWNHCYVFFDSCVNFEYFQHICKVTTINMVCFPWFSR